ncbi:MAG: pyruvate formate lyase family protein, partial [Pseudomonadota bacterium]
TSSYKETEGLPMPIRRAKAFEKVITEIPIFIDEDQLLVGDYAARPMSAEWFCDFYIHYVVNELENDRPPYGLGETEVVEMKEICDYWKGRNARDSFLTYFDTFYGEDERKRIQEMDDEGAWVYGFFICTWGGKGWNSPDYEKGIKKGFTGILAEVEEELKSTAILDDASRKKACFLKALSIALKAGISYAKRYAALARELASTADGTRRLELERIAETCDWVPANPARNFREALQTMWFIHALSHIDQEANGVAPGRMDQYLYPYYKRDIDEGTLTPEETIELLECLRCKSGIREFNQVYSHQIGYGDSQFHNITLGGVNPEGEDATNDLSFHFLEAAMRTRTPHPTLTIRWHDKLNPEFAMKAAELCRIGLGFPAWYGDKATIPFWLKHGATLEEARDYQISGCVVHTIPHKTAMVMPMVLNMPKIFELALYNGFDPSACGQWGPETGDFEDMQSWEEVRLAFRKQLDYFMTRLAGYLNEARLNRAAILPPVFMSAFFDDCIKRGDDCMGGGCLYQQANTYVMPIGTMDVVDSLIAIKKCVFEDCKVNKKELLDALASNFEGYEEIRRLLLAAPKYGNNDDYADIIARDMYQMCVDLFEEKDAAYGSKWRMAPHTLFLHGELGKRVGALPSGRQTGLSTADGGISPCQGMDTKGPTATIMSAGKIDQVPLQGAIFNMKFHPFALSTKEDLQKFISLLKTYFDLGGKHIQFNVVSADTLIDAQYHPENYRNLVVRVAGYSVLWVELDRTLQDEIIMRTEKGWN